MVKALRLGVRAPALFALDEGQRSLTMQEVPGASVKEYLLSLPAAAASTDAGR